MVLAHPRMEPCMDINPALVAVLEKRVADLEATDPATVESLPAHNQRLRQARLSLARVKGSHTTSQWLALVAECDRNCVRCGKHHEEPTLPVKGHIQPLAAGGSDGIENIMPLCRNCASARGAEGIDWLEAYRETHGLNAGASA